MESTNLTEAEAIALVSALAGMTMVIVVVGVILGIVKLIAQWRLFAKAGEPGWKALIPVYGEYIRFKVAWNPMMFWVMLGISAVAIFFGALSGSFGWVGSQITYVGGGNTVLAILSGVGCLALVFMEILLLVKTAYAYGKGAGFAVGLVLLNTIFTLILAFGSSEYVGPQE